MAISSTLDDQAVRRILADRIDVQHKSVGMVVGLITPQGCRVISHRQNDLADARPLDGDTVFELASITKVFTAMLLADMVWRGEVTLDDPVSRHLPPSVKIPSRKGRQITLVDLVTHTSALPLMPTDHPGINSPAAADYSLDRLYRFLATYKLPRDIGSEWEYANLDIALLGHALAHRAGMEYSRLIRTRVTEPLGLGSTAIDITSDMAPRLAVSHDADLRPAPRMALGAFAPAGAMMSSANDLLKLLAISLGMQPSPLSPSLSLMLDTRRPWQPSLWTMVRRHWRMMVRVALSRPRAGAPAAAHIRTEQALGWYVHRQSANEMVVHDGASPTCAASIAYDPKERLGVVVLSNTGTMVMDVSRHLLWGWPLAKPRLQVPLDPSLLDRYVGQYATGFGPPLAITRGGNRLLVDFPFMGQTEVRPENDREFFIAEFGMGFRFELDDRGAVRRAFFQPGRGQPEVPVKKT